MGELKDLLQQAYDNGFSIRSLAESIGINYNTLYTFGKTQYGKQLPKKESYLKLKEYFGEDIMVNGEPLIYAKDSDRALRFKSEEERNRYLKIQTLKFESKEEKTKFQNVVDILEFNERTIIPSCFINQEERLIGLLSMVGINAKYWFVDHNGYLEKIVDIKPIEGVHPIKRIVTDKGMTIFDRSILEEPEEQAKLETLDLRTEEPEESTESDIYTLTDFEGNIVATQDIKKYVSKDTDFKPGDIEELAKDERFKPTLSDRFIVNREGVTLEKAGEDPICLIDGDGNLTEEGAKRIILSPSTKEDKTTEIDRDSELNQTVNYLVGLVKDKMWKEFEEKQKEIHSLMELEPMEALRLIRENNML